MMFHKENETNTKLKFTSNFLLIEEILEDKFKHY